MTSTLNRLSERVFTASLTAVRDGVLQLKSDDTVRRFGQASSPPSGGDAVQATLEVRDPRFYFRALTGADIGIGESFMDGDWTSPDLVALVRLMLRNSHAVEAQGQWVRPVRRAIDNLARRLRDNSVTGSRRNIREHYDLGNDFFRLFLDEQLMYSCALYETGHETLEQAQRQKLDRICQKLDLGPRDHVLEIGTGWGGFAAWAASHYGCRVTTTTISEEQHRYARDAFARLGETGSRITLLLEDYRQLTGQFDKIVSIEMFEAVGLNHYDDYFGAVDRLLSPHGSMLLQTITVSDQYFPEYHATPDWIEKYIFPGGELASIGEILASLARSTTVSLYHAENIGTHYARTIHEWRDRFHRHLDAARRLGYDERFLRMWDLYLAYCEAAFLERHAGVFQLVLAKNNSRAGFFNEPWAQADARASAVA